MLSLGLKFVINQKDMCSILTTVYTPSHIDVGVLRQKLREKSIIIYEGKGYFKNHVFQVGNIGDLSFTDIQYFLNSLKKVLDSFKPIGELLPVIEQIRMLGVVGIDSQTRKSIPEIEKTSANLLTLKATL
jgi:aspartate aminotransferase-like enzyme